MDKIEQRHEDPIEELIQAAREGDSDAFGELLMACQKYLSMIAEREVPQELNGKLAPSDLIQDTLLEAQRDFQRFAGRSRPELLVWLRRILMHNLVDANRRFNNTAKRDLSREVSLHQQADSSYAIDLPQEATTPSAFVRADERESLVTAALEKLPEHYRTVISFRNRDGLSFPEIAERMNRSPEAVRKLWVRAIDQLREILEDLEA